MEANQTLQSQRFTFGQAQQTQYLSYDIIDTKNQLSYNPFAFDLKLALIKSQPNYEQPGTFFDLSNQKTTIFCRKKKKQKLWTDQQSTPIYLLAQKISEKHFSIDSSYQLKDLKSKHGTYVWIGKDQPFKLKLKDQFFIAKELLIINVLIQHPKRFIQFTYKGKTHRIQDSNKPFLIGSHKSCSLIVPQLYEFQVCINASTLSIFTTLDQEWACSQHGLWYKLRTNPQPQGIYIEHGTIILADPYIFKVTS